MLNRSSDRCSSLYSDRYQGFIGPLSARLRDPHVRYRDYDPDNPLLLRQTEQLLLPDYPDYNKFSKLSQQERKWGLLDDVAAIHDCRDWERCLEEHCAELLGHRVVWRKDADPYRVKVVKSAIRNRHNESTPSNC